MNFENIRQGTSEQPHVSREKLIKYKVMTLDFIFLHELIFLPLSLSLFSFENMLRYFWVFQ